VTATPPPSHKKTKKNGFFAPLGCLFALLNPGNKENLLKEKVKLHTNAPEEKSGLFAHFFRRLPTGIYLKKNILQWQSSKKIERLIFGFFDEVGFKLW
jgi:hypothetical protein